MTYNENLETPTVEGVTPALPGGALMNVITTAIPAAAEEAKAAMARGDVKKYNGLVSKGAQIVDANSSGISAIADLEVTDATPPVLKILAERAKAARDSGGLPGMRVAPDEAWESPEALNRFAALNHSSMSVATLDARSRTGKTTRYEENILETANILASKDRGTYSNFEGDPNDYVRFATKWGDEFGRTFGTEAPSGLGQALSGIATQAFMSGSTTTERNESMVQLLGAAKFGKTPEDKVAMLSAVAMGLKDAMSRDEVDSKGNPVPGTSFAALSGTGASGMIVENLGRMMRKDTVTDESLRRYTSTAARMFNNLVGGTSPLPDQLHVLAEIAVHQALPPERQAGSLSPIATKYIETDNAEKWAPQNLLLDKGNDGGAAATIPALVSAIAPVFKQMVVAGGEFPEDVTPIMAMEAAVRGDLDVLDKFSPAVRQGIDAAQKTGLQQAALVINGQYGVSLEDAHIVALNHTLGANAAALTTSSTYRESFDKLDPTGMLTKRHVPGKNIAAAALDPTDIVHFASELAKESTVPGSKIIFTGDDAKDEKIRTELTRIAAEVSGYKEPVTERQQQARDVEAPKVYDMLSKNDKYMSLKPQYVHAVAVGDKAQIAKLEAEKNKIIHDTIVDMYGVQDVRQNVTIKVNGVETPYTNVHYLGHPLERSLEALGRPRGGAMEIAPGKFGEDAFADIGKTWVDLEKRSFLRADGPSEVRVDPAKMARYAAFEKEAYGMARSRAASIDNDLNERVLRYGLNPERVRSVAAKVKSVTDGMSLEQTRDAVVAALTKKASSPDIPELVRLSYFDLIRKASAAKDPMLLASMLATHDATLASDDLKKKLNTAELVAEASAKGRKKGDPTGSVAPAAPDSDEEDAGKSTGV